MPKYNKFKCKSEAQKKAIRASYARMAEKATTKGIRLGMTLSTYDRYLPHEKKLKENKKRPVVVIEKNIRNEIAVVSLSSRNGRNRTHLPNYQQGQSYFKHFVEIEDNEGNPIVLGEKFRANSPKQDVSKRDLREIRSVVFTESILAHRNLNKIKKFRKK